MAKTFKLPDLGEGIHEAEIIAVRVKTGETVKEGDVILDVETDKAIVEIPSPFTGQVSAVHIQPGDRVSVGGDLITFDIAGDQTAAPEKSPAPPETSPAEEAPREAAAASGSRVIPASPATRRLARELGVALDQVTPNGPEGLVTAADVKAFAQGAMQEAADVGKAIEVDQATSDVGKPITREPPPLPDFTRWGPVRREKMKGVRRATARQMTLSWSQVPHVNTQDFADITRLEALRNEYKARVKEKGGNLTLTVFVLKAIATALKSFPRFNASLDTETEEIILKDYYHIGVATDTPDGLIVPVIRDVDRKSIVELAVEMTDLVERTRIRKTKLEEMQGGSFTITNAGAMGGGYFSPIINYPEVAIMGLGRAAWTPVVKDGASQKPEIVARLMLPLILCIDHRVLDGADGVRFLLMVKAALEDPQELMMTMI